MLEVPETSGRGGGRSRVIAPSRANGTAPGRERVSGSYRANGATNRAARQARPQVQRTGEISIVSPENTLCPQISPIMDRRDGRKMEKEKQENRVRPCRSRKL